MQAIPVSVPDGRSGQWTVSTIEVTEAQARLDNMRNAMRGQRYLDVKPGFYKRLAHDKRGCVMSNTPMEIYTNSSFIYRAKGNVLVNGLGLGVVLTAILAKAEVERVTVIEISQDVIALVAPHFQSAIDAERLRIVHANCYEYTPPKGEKYDAVWHDVWDTICVDNLAEMTRLKRKYARRARWQGCWAEDEIRAERRRW